MNEKIQFTDSCPYDEVASVITKADIGIIPYRSDGYMQLVLPTKAFEFAWMRRPMIISDIVGARSLFRPASVEFCKPAQPASFAAVIIRLYRDVEARASLVENAAKDYRFFRWEAMASRYQHLLLALSKRCW